jgi:hypothetical protein
LFFPHSKISRFPRISSCVFFQFPFCIPRAKIKLKRA